jgi:hypothetical protein
LQFEAFTILADYELGKVPISRVVGEVEASTQCLALNRTHFCSVRKGP